MPVRASILAACALWFGGVHVSLASEAASRHPGMTEQIRALTVPSPYRIPDSARRGKIQYRIAVQGNKAGWTWPETGEQHVVRTDDGVELTICDDCGDEDAPTEDVLRDMASPTAWLQSGDRGVVSFSREARGGSIDKRMRNLVSAVRSRLSGGVTYDDYLSARDALHSRHGDCTEYALLLAAAARARGIPTRVVAGLAYGSRFVGQPHVFGPHMWVQAWNGNRWISYDAGLGAFDSGHLALAVGDGSPASLAGVLDLIRRLRIVDAAGIIPDAGKSG